jgi:hypothetical protein
VFENTLYQDSHQQVGVSTSRPPPTVRTLEFQQQRSKVHHRARMVAAADLCTLCPPGYQIHGPGPVGGGWRRVGSEFRGLMASGLTTYIGAALGLDSR